MAVILIPVYQSGIKAKASVSFSIYTAKNLQPNLGCFSCSLASSSSLAWSTSWGRSVETWKFPCLSSNEHESL